LILASGRDLGSSVSVTVCDFPLFWVFWNPGGARHLNPAGSKGF